MCSKIYFKSFTSVNHTDICLFITVHSTYFCCRFNVSKHPFGLFELTQRKQCSQACQIRQSQLDLAKTSVVPSNTSVAGATSLPSEMPSQALLKMPTPTSLTSLLAEAASMLNSVFEPFTVNRLNSWNEGAAPLCKAFGVVVSAAVSPAVTKSVITGVVLVCRLVGSRHTQ